MQKNKVDLMVESFFKPVTAKKDNELSLDDLISIINEVKSTIPSLVLEAGERMNLGGPPLEMPKTPQSKGSSETINLTSIPEISVSELGWASLKTTDSGEKISSPQRAQLEQYLTNIEGSTFAEKIQSISSLFSMTDEELQQSAFLSAESNAGKIQKTLAYLVFLKTLTTIITNFNAASAGFSFEAFLGVLLGGGQQATGGGTIADLYDSAGTPISLKLYAEDGLEVGGSFTDLIGDMVKPKTSVELMRYIVVTKTLSGKGLEAEGLVKFYQFDIDLNNIFDVMMLSENKELIRLPQSFLQNPEGSDFVSLKRTTKKAEVPQEEVDKVFFNVLTNQIGGDYTNIVMTAIKNEADDLPIFATDEEQLKKIGTPFNKSFSNDMINIIQAQTNKPIEKEEARNIDNAIKQAFKAAKEYRDKTGVAVAGKKREADLKQLAFASPEESYSAYQSYSPEVKKKALANSYGYLYTEQFAMTRNQVFSVMQGKKMKRGGSASEPIGTIKIGSRNIEAIFKRMAANLNNSIFEIFNNLSVLTRSINSYFATGLRDQNAADSAQQAAQNIDKKTGEIKQTT